jgi:hypothetical protein
MTFCTGRRAFITFLGGAAVAWPLAARAQQPDRMRRIGVLMTTSADDPEGQSRIAAFHQGLQQWGWTPRLQLVPPAVLTRSPAPSPRW